ncbi:unnamed protein product, partial [Soboliphyme baturini]|uniref:Antirestriction protein n=1 Tax=Soboliphyme baturini TaxID=241478 RepID=A0A183J3Y4_9BILA
MTEVGSVANAYDSDPEDGGIKLMNGCGKYYALLEDTAVFSCGCVE